MRCLVFQATKPQKPQKCPNSEFHHPIGMITYERILTCPEANSWASTRGLWAGKAIRPHLYGHSSSLRGTGLAHVPCFYSIGKLITRFDFHRTVNWPHKSASRGHRIWHEEVPTHGRSRMAAMNLWQFYPVSLIGLPMPLFQSPGKPNTPSSLCSIGVCHPTASLRCQFPLPNLTDKVS